MKPLANRTVVHLLLMVSVLTACRDPRLLGTQSDIVFVPATLELPAVFPGKTSEAEVVLRNSGRQTPALELLPLPGGFEAIGTPTRASSGDQTFKVRFVSQEPGRFTQVLRVLAESGTSYALPVAITVKPIPTCPMPISCHAARFDLREEKCVEEPVPEGTACEEQNVCLLEGRCQSGRCVGKARVCDDDNRCTVDVCNARTGCEFLPSPPCPGDGKCQLGTCHPKTGCGTVAASDGTLCGAGFDCDLVDVCMEGECVQRDPADNHVCAPASPCQAEGRCRGSVCEQPAATTLVPNWSMDTIGWEQNGNLLEVHDFVVERGGEVSVSGFFGPVIARANTPSATARPSMARRCQLWNGQLVCADHPSDTETGKVSVIDPATAEIEWTFDAVDARPDFARLGAPGMMFMARMASLGTDRLAALFEAYPAGTDSRTECRLYFLVMLNSQGTLLYAQQLKDPLLDICNHPHPFGFTADSVGNLFIAFSGSAIGNAPLEAASPTLLMAFSRDGILQWKRQDAFVGGELATARGLLFPERSTQAYQTSNGTVAYPLAAGRAVATQSRVVASPESGAASLSGFDLMTGAPRWQTSAPGGHAFATEVIRLAELKVRPELSAEPAVLSMLRSTDASSPGLSLWATRASDGTPLWSCAIQSPGARGDPTLFEITDGQLTFMDGTQTCGRCDPPFARSQAQFVTVPLPGVSASTSSPWPGTAGGPAHEYQERSLFGLWPPQ